MPFPPELQAKVDAIRARSSAVVDRASALKAKLAAREGRSGFAQNVVDLRARIAAEEADAPEES
jgi:hypothetical protein